MEVDHDGMWGYWDEVSRTLPVCWTLYMMYRTMRLVWKKERVFLGWIGSRVRMTPLLLFCGVEVPRHQGKDEELVRFSDPWYLRCNLILLTHYCWPVAPFYCSTVAQLEYTLLAEMAPPLRKILYSNWKWTEPHTFHIQELHLRARMEIASMFQTHDVPHTTIEKSMLRLDCNIDARGRSHMNRICKYSGCMIHKNVSSLLYVVQSSIDGMWACLQ